MAPDSSTIAWKIPWTEEPGGLQPMGHKRVRHNLATKQQQQPTHLFLLYSFLQPVKNPPAMWDTWVRSLGWEDPLEKRKATHSSIPGLPLWFSW